MALRFTNRTTIATDDFATRFEAFDGERRVVVVVSDEVLDDYGAIRAKQKASDKYIRGEVEGEYLVRVVTADF